MTASFTAAIPIAAPFDVLALLDFLRSRAVTGVEIVEGLRYARTIRLPSGAASMAITFPDPDLAREADSTIEATFVGPAMRANPSARDRTEAIRQVRHLVGADTDAAAVDRTLRSDPVLAAAVRAAPGIRVPGCVDGPEILIRALVGQQVSVAAARTALGKLTAAVGETITAAIPGLTHLFPSPGGIARIGPDAIAGPRRRAATIWAASRDMATGSLLIDQSRSAANLTAELVARPGIGPWTAGYVAMRVLADPDVLLTGDLALRNGAAALGLPDQPGALGAYGARWSPYRSFAGMYLWRACPPPVRRPRGVRGGAADPVPQARKEQEP